MTDAVLLLPKDEALYGRTAAARRHEYHLGLAYLAAIGRAAGHRVDVVDMAAEEKSDEAVLADLAAARPSLVGFPLLTPLVPATRALARRVREALPRAFLLAGGPHATALPEATLADFTELNAVAEGEAEETFREVLAACAAGRTPNGVAGLWLRSAGRAVRPAPRALVPDLNRLPFPWRDRRHLSRYRAPLYFGVEAPYLNVMTSRGCPYRCSFCGQRTTFKGTVRFRAPENVLEEMREYYDRDGIRIFFFDDSTFVLDRDRVFALCDLLCRHLPGIRWGAMGRVNLSDEPLCRAMRRAGGELLHFGIESGDPGILASMNKDIDLEQVPVALRQARRAGIKTHASFILGMPGETRESLERTIRLACRLDSDYASFSLATPYPGTAFYETARAEGFDPAGWEAYRSARYGTPVYVPRGLARDELAEALGAAYRRFYRRPRFIMRQLMQPANYLNLRRSLSVFRSFAARRPAPGEKNRGGKPMNDQEAWGAFWAGRRTTRMGRFFAWVHDHFYYSRFAGTGWFAPGDIVLESGCGFGEVSRAMQTDGRLRVIGLDISHQTLCAARRESPPGFHQVAGDCRRLPFRAGAIHCVVTDGVLEHFTPDDARIVLREWRRAARRIICIVPARSLRWRLFRRLKTHLLGTDQSIGHLPFVLYDEATLRRLLQETGYTRISFSPFPLLIFPQHLVVAEQ